MEGLYLMHTREFIATNKPIMKLGRSNNTENRTNQYPKGSRIMLMIACKNSIACEAYLINLFKTKFKQAKYYGTEYFEGNYRDMIKEICNYVNNLDIVEDVIEEEKVVKKEKKVVKKVVDKVVDKVVVKVVDKVVVKEDKEKEEKKKKEKEKKEKEEKKKDEKNKVNNILDRTCPKCNYIFKYPSRLKKHFETVIHCRKSETEIEEYFSNIKKNIIIFKCSGCNKNFSRKDSLNRHCKTLECSKPQ